MATQDKIVERWRYLRGMLTEQLDAIDAGRVQVHSADIDVSVRAMATLKKEIAEFDRLIAEDAAQD